jgi:LacI family transcriptional regulator, gluconate utilization system Gnt-I transcriptional repressor
MSLAPSPSKRTRRGSGAVTLHEVAQKAGVAPITASRALNSPDKVSPEALQRVTEAVQTLGYVPNRLAGGLASTRSRLVAALVPTMAGPVFLQTVQSLTQALAAQGYQLMLGQTGYADPRTGEDLMLEALIGRRPDGIVLTGTLHSAQARQRLQAAGIPVVETWDLSDHPIDMLVGFSHEGVGRSVAAFFHTKGYKRWALVAGDDPRSQRRQHAFSQAALELGLPPIQAVTVPAPTTLKSGRLALRQLLQGAPDVDAVFCSSDLLALGVLTEARAQGRAVPEQLAVMGFGDLDFAADLEPALSTVHIDGAAMGRQAARFIMDRAEGRNVAQPVLDIRFSLIERSST